MKLLTRSPQYMRLDATVYHPFNLEAKVLLDGVEQKLVVVADEEQGFIVRYKRDEKGKFIFDQHEVMTEVLQGTVQILHPWRLDKRRAYNK